MNESSFLFYDLETTGKYSGQDRIMQFAGQRTDLDLNPIEDPHNYKIKVADDILPAPEAILITKMNPLDNQNGLTEAEFSEIFNSKIATPGTIFVGFNNLRFDDNFIRYSNYRNFYDPYKWHWEAGKSRWDIIDLVRLTRALRPDGINWPELEGKPSNKLELLSKENNLVHDSAHDALSDVTATIGVAGLIKARQPRLFNYLLELRRKDAVVKLLNKNKTLLYCTTGYSSENLHTSIVQVIDINLVDSQAKVFDLREDATRFLDMSPEQLAEEWKYDPETKKSTIPIKTVKINRCPAFAELSALDEASVFRLNLDLTQIEKNKKVVVDNLEILRDKITKATEILNSKDQANVKLQRMVDETLYDGFTSNQDAALFPRARSLDNVQFSQSKLNDLYKLYKARNYPNSDPGSDQYYRDFVREKLIHSSVLEEYIKHVSSLLTKELTDLDKSLMEDLIDRARSIQNVYE